MLLTGHVACRSIVSMWMYLQECVDPCVCVCRVKRGWQEKKKTTFKYICVTVSKEFVPEIFGGNWSKPKWTPWLLGRMLHPAERDLGQRRGLHGLRQRDWGVTPGNMDKWVPPLIFYGVSGWGHECIQDTGTKGCVCMCVWHGIAPGDCLIRWGQILDKDKRNVLARLCS